MFELFDEGERARLCANIAAAMQTVPDAIAERQIALFTRVHPEYGAGVQSARATLAKES